MNSVHVSIVCTTLTLSNSVMKAQIHAAGHVFASASEDESCRLFDVRSDQELVRNVCPGTKFSSVALSNSCRLLMAGAEDDNVHVFDSIKGLPAGEHELQTSV